MPTAGVTSARDLISGYFFWSAAKTALDFGLVVAGKAERLDEMHFGRARPGKFGEATARGSPMRNDRNIPSHAIERLHHLRGRRNVGDEEQGIRAGLLKPRQLRHDINVVGLELFDGCKRYVLGFKRRLSPFSLDSPQELLIRIIPGFLAPYFLTA